MTWQYKRIIIEAIVISCLGVVVGLSINHRMVMNAFTGETVPVVETEPDPASVASYPTPVSLREVRDAMEKDALIIDARVEDLYRDAHIPGAISLPMADMDPEVESLKRNIAPDRTLIVYCSGYGCPDSFDLGVRLLEEGFRDVRVYEGGLPEWRDHGLPIEKGMP